MIILAIGIISNSLSQGYAQTVETSPWTTLSGDLANDPVAQDILRKIELTKQWIADLEQKNYKKLEAEKMLEEKRAIALERLNQDLKEWDALWSNYTSRASFERFVDDKPSEVQGVFWDAFEFKEMKVKAGRDALKQVIANGGTMREARDAYIQAAETKRIELIEANAQFNVKYNLAYYKQQLFFDIQGQFVNTTETRTKLNQYYTDYRADPAYLAANPDAEILGTDITEQTSKKDLDAIVYLINQKFRDLGDEAEAKKPELIKHYDQLYEIQKEEAKKAEKEIIGKFNSGSMTKKELSDLIIAIRDKYKDSMEGILNEKIQSLDELKMELDKQALDIISENEKYHEIEIAWNSDTSSYEAVVKTAADSLESNRSP